MSKTTSPLLHEVYGMDARALQELHTQREIMDCVPYNQPIKKLVDAFKGVERGKVVAWSPGVWKVQGSQPGPYTVTKEGCTCKANEHSQKSRWACWHTVAAELYDRWQKALQPLLPLPLGPSTPEEHLAQTPPPAAQVAPQPTIPTPDDPTDVSTPETILEAPRAAQETAMAAPQTDAYIPEPTPAANGTHPAPPAPAVLLRLPLRSISAIVADLSRPLPSACIATKTQGGQTIPFLHWQTVARLLDTYAPGWHGAVTRLDQVGKACAITYRLTIPCLEGEVSREATGQEEEEVKGYGDSTSNSEAMAFKRAAAKFGVGQWLYDKANDPTAGALAEHFRQEKEAALAALGHALDSAGIDRERTITWLRTQTGAAKNTELPLWAIRALLAHVTQAA